MATFPTLDDIKEALGIEDDDHDEALQSMLDSTVAMVENYLGRGIEYGPQVDEFDAPDSNNPALLLWRFPIDTVNSVSVDDAAIPAGNYRVQKRSGIVRWRHGCCVINWEACCHEAPRIVVDYIGGYPDDE